LKVPVCVKSILPMYAIAFALAVCPIGTATAQSKFFSTPSRGGAEGGKQNAQITAFQSEHQRMNACTAQGRIYGPAHPNADTDGCIEGLRAWHNNGPIWDFSDAGVHVQMGIIGGTGAIGTFDAPTDFRVLTNSADRLIVKGDGNIGIGTTSPAQLLHLASTDNASMRLTSGSGLSSLIEHFNGAAAGGGIGLFPSSDTRLFNIIGADLTNANAPVTVLRNGNVGVGTTSPVDKLHVAGNIRTDRPAGWSGLDMYVNGNNRVTAYNMNGSFAIDTGLSRRLEISPSGSLVIHNPSSGYALETPGYVKAFQLRWTDSVYSSSPMCYSTGSGTYISGFCSSLRKLKNDIQDLSFGMDALMKLRPVEYTWKPEQGGHDDLGFIAEEVEAISPRLVTYDKDGGLLGVKYHHLTALLTKAAQELREENATLKVQLELLTKRIEAIEEQRSRRGAPMSHPL